MGLKNVLANDEFPPKNIMNKATSMTDSWKCMIYDSFFNMFPLNFVGVRVMFLLSTH